MTVPAVVSIAALDVRRRPGHRSELRSQLLMGEIVDVLAMSRDGKWSRVVNRVDLYRGWVRNWGLVRVDEREARTWARAASWRVTSRHLELRSSPGRGSIVGPLFWNSAVAVAGVEGRFARVRLPDGTEGWAERRALRRKERKAGSLGSVIRGFEGVPYLWGGRTPLGFDCSGFVQQALVGVGISVPRDAHDQFVACRPVLRLESIRFGDLLFFGPRGKRMTHVAIALGRGLFAHARGKVRVNSLDDSNHLYDKRLTSSLRAAGRP